MAPRVLGLPLTLAAVFAAASCGSTPPPAGIATGCSIDSDCQGALVCAFGRCHKECKTSKDCGGGTCLPPSDVCELPEETRCSATLPCVDGLTCADDVCRASCTPGVANDTSGGCLGAQTCALISRERVCIDSSTDGGAVSGDAGRDSSERRDANPVVPSSDGGLGFTPSNVELESVDAGIGDAGQWASAPDVSLTFTGNQDCATSPDCNGLFSPSTRITTTQSDGNIADLFILNSLTLPDNASLSFSSANPVILAVLTTASIQGTIYVNDGKAGGFSITVPGRGAGQGGDGFATYSGWGGGSYCGVGGRGGTSTQPVPAGGSTYGAAGLIPLVAGSNGGGSNAVYGGVGGGAIQIVAGQSITVGPAGRIDASGQGSGNEQGGGSGGAILLEAPSVVIQGALAANGGGGGGGNGTAGADGSSSGQPALGGQDGNGVDGGTAVGGVGSAGTTLNGGNGGPPDPGVFAGGGGGGAGRIRINTSTGSANISAGSVISPAPKTACMTQGILKP